MEQDSAPTITERVDSAPSQTHFPAESQPAKDDKPADERGRGRGRKQDRGKRKWGKDKFQHGAKHKRKDLGRGEYYKQQLDKRERNDAERAKRQKLDHEGGQKPASVLPAAFSQEEIAAEDRRPKRKVAVMIGYSGSGYKGMQIMPDQRTIEGDLFTAFVAAGAISKANADDPKKSSLVRCARTDKGVHAAGNVISLKLIVEDPDIVQRINDHLSPQIRVWGIERTTGSFSCYQMCDSRWYEYLIPTHTLIPPHPNSWLGKKLVEIAEKTGDLEGYKQRQEEAADFWASAEEEYIKPVLESLDESTRETVQKALYEDDEEPEGPGEASNEDAASVAEAAADIAQPIGSAQNSVNKPEDITADERTEEDWVMLSVPTQSGPTTTEDEIQPATEDAQPLPTETASAGSNSEGGDEQKKALESAIKALKSAYITAKRSYRLPPSRLTRLRSALESYIGTHNYHNYTVRKSARDASAKRVIKSFTASDPFIQENGTEWLSLKVHGQSFMMHQIRKMVGMAALVVRCGCPVSRIKDTLGTEGVSIPKAPGLGLLLERPVFDTYNAKAVEKFQKAKIEFTPYEKEMEEFKQREIYGRIWREEERDNIFHTFFSHIDSYREPYFLFLSSGGIQAVKDAEVDKHEKKGKRKIAEISGVESEDEGEDSEG